MPHTPFDRFAVIQRPLAERENRAEIERDQVDPQQPAGELPPLATETLAEAAQRIVAARANDRPVMLAYGAHTTKNRLVAYRANHLARNEDKHAERLFRSRDR